MDHTRRSALAAGAGALASLTGCLGIGGGSETLEPAGGGGVPSTTATMDGTPEGGVTSLPDHPATAGIGSQPRLGSLSRPGVIVAFEDPSCPRCKRFETGTLPDIRSKLVDTGKASFVWRGYPVVYEWGEPATRALEATFDRGGPPFWKLQAFYYRKQSNLGTKNVYDRTRTFLDENTEIDADAVVTDSKSGAYDDAVRMDLDAGESAGAQSTPTFYLFKDGEYRTTVTGPQDYDVFANALGF